MLSRLWTGLGMTLAALLLVTATPALAGGQKNALVYPDKLPQPPRAQSAPDVQVLILSSMSGVDQVNITYPTVVPRAQVARDINSLATLSAWPMGGVQIDNSAMKLIGVKAAPMTSVTFAAQGPVHKDERGFWLEPFVVALRSYKKLTISYMVPRKFVFAGLQNYSDSHVHISLQQRGSVYTYNVSIDNPNFSRLNLPMWQPSASTPSGVVRQTMAPRREHTLRALRLVSVALVGALAVLVGFGVYAVLSRTA